jgi:hypothetical protein
MSYVEVTITNNKTGEVFTWNFHEMLMNNLKELIRHNKKDWDFKILISGDGMTRDGKTTIASQISRFLDPDSDEEHNWCYDGSKLRSMGIALGKSAVLVYDEAKEGLDSKKAMHKYSQNIVEYFSECGYLNQFLIIILPDYFDLNKSVALNMSICLINVMVDNNFDRGYFEFYNRVDKRNLYIKGKQYHDYTVHKPTFKGTFSKYFPYDYDKLEKMKQANIIRRDTNGEVLGKMERRYKARTERAMCWLWLKGWTQKEIAKVFSGDIDQLTQQEVSRIVGKNENEV